jgi:hypothetical protein
MADSENGDLSKMCEFVMEFAQGNENSDLADAINITWGSLAIGSITLPIDPRHTESPTTQTQSPTWNFEVGFEPIASDPQVILIASARSLFSLPWANSISNSHIFDKSPFSESAITNLLCINVGNFLGSR